MVRRMALAALLSLVFSSVVLADNASGKITVVQTSGSGTRFFMGAQKLSLFTTSAEHRALLLEAFAAQANVDVGFTKIACTGGITGTCGTVNFVSVDASAIP